MIHSPATLVARGGLWTQVQKTAQALRSLGVEVFVSTSPESDAVRSFDLCHIMGANMATYHIARELDRKGMPLVVSPVFFSLHSTSFLRVALSAQKVFNKFVHGLWTDYGFIAEIAQWSRAVLPNTHGEAMLLRAGLGIPQEKILPVPNGVDERFYSATPDLFRKRYGIEQFILHVGNFWQGRKNTLRLIRVLRDINRPAVIIGQSEDRTYYERCRQEASLNPRILLLDELANDSDLLASAYAACDVFVLPSMYETPGIAALEAGLAGAKIVITKYGGTTEYFGEWAEYVEPTSDHSIAKGIYAALAKPKAAELREHIRSKFLWKTVGESTLDIYRKVLR